VFHEKEKFRHRDKCLFADLPTYDSFLSHWKNYHSGISFDIDVYDISYLPCTGTPEPFGLNPFQILDIVNSISDTARLVGLDFVETGLKNNDYREGALATQTLLRILSRPYMANQ